VDAEQLNTWRINRLRAAIDKLTDGNATAFGQLLGFKDGAYIRQMLSGTRPISEKFVLKLQARRGMADWFSPNGNAGPLEAQIKEELAAREIPEHVLSSVLVMLRGFPERNAPHDNQADADRRRFEELQPRTVKPVVRKKSA
jgi:hypothetical protein